MTTEEIVSKLCSAFPAWATGTLVLRDQAGELIGHGRLARSDTGVSLTLTSAACPSDWSALVAAHEVTGG
jgi:hypothetical protein